MLSWAVVGAVVAVGTVAAVDPFGSAGQPEPEARSPQTVVSGPDVPPPGALQGTLVLVGGEACSVRVLELSDLSLGPPGLSTACRLWAAPRGDLVAVALRPERAGAADLGLVDVQPDRVRLVARRGRLASAPSWSPDGSRVAWCGERGTVVLNVPAGQAVTRAGCYPSFAPDGTLRTRDREGTGRADRVLGVAIGPDGTLIRAVLKAEQGFPQGALELSRRGVSVARIELGRLYTPASWFHGLRVEVSPSGAEAALVFPGTLARPVADDLAAFVDLAGRAELEELEAQPFSGLAWSPDGAWLALATGGEIQIYGPDRTTPVYVLPVSARAVAWRR
jgi:hypothetical protein